MKILLLFVMVLMSQTVFAHGENKLGPHKGYIRMPGAFHTEVVPDGDTKFKIYLLDINFKKPSTKDSKLEVKILDNEKTGEVICTPNKDHYQCQLPNDFSLKKGQLIVKAIRENTPGAEMPYDLPLSVNSDGSNSGGSHSSHH